MKKGNDQCGWRKKKSGKWKEKKIKGSGWARENSDQCICLIEAPDH